MFFDIKGDSSSSFILPDNGYDFDSDQTLATIGQVMKNAFINVKSGQLNFFKSCCFKKQDLNSLFNGGSGYKLSLAIFYIINEGTGQKELTLAAYPTINASTNPSRVFLSTDLNLDLTFTGIDWVENKICIWKDNEEVPEYFSVPCNTEVYSQNYQDGFISWLSTFNIKRIVENYPSEALIVHFNESDLSPIFASHLCKYIAFVPIVLRSTGGMTTNINLGKIGDYTSYFLLPLDQNNEVIMGLTGNEYEFMVSGRLYPRPWEYFPAKETIKQRFYLMDFFSV